MSDRNTFMETLREVEQIVRTSPGQLTREEILGYFKDSGLNEEQENMVFKYLTTPHDDTQEQAEQKENKETQLPAQKHSKALELYLEDLEKLPEYTDEELETMYEEVLNGNIELIDSVSHSMLKNVALLADEYASDKAGVEDLIQEGNMALFMRLSELCGMGAESGYDLVDEVSDAVNEAMKSYVSRISDEEASENIVVGKANLVREARKHLLEENKSEPSAAQISEYTHMPEEELNDIMGIIKDNGK